MASGTVKSRDYVVLHFPTFLGYDAPHNQSRFVERRNSNVNADNVFFSSAEIKIIASRRRDDGKCYRS